MSGRGIPGGGLVRQHKPEDVKVNLGLRTTTSAPTSIFSLAPPASTNTTHPSKLAGPPALGYIAHERGGFTRDLRDSWDFITIPPAGQGKEKAEVVARHLLPRGNLRFYSKTGGEGELKPEKGEKFVVGPSAGSLGTFWWRWGDLSGDLADKKFRADEWWDGDGGEDGGQALAGEGGEWVQSEGENGFGLTMEVESGAEVKFI